MYEENGSDREREYEMEPKERKRKKDGSGRVGGRLVALCLCCVLLGGYCPARHFTVEQSFRKNWPDSNTTAGQSDGSGGITSSVSPTTVKTYTSNTNDTYTATDIYYKLCRRRGRYHHRNDLSD
jgi:hypothetical protein